MAVRMAVRFLDKKDRMFNRTVGLEDLTSLRHAWLDHVGLLHGIGTGRQGTVDPSSEAIQDCRKV